MKIQQYCMLYIYNKKECIMINLPKEKGLSAKEIICADTNNCLPLDWVHGFRDYRSIGHMRIQTLHISSFLFCFCHLSSNR